MKSRHRIRRSGVLLHAQQIECGQLGHRFAQRLGQHRVLAPGRVPQYAQQSRPARASAGRRGQLLEVVDLEWMIELPAETFVKPHPESRHRRQRGKHLQPRQVALQVLDDTLQQKISQRDSAQSHLRTRDRIEDCGIRVLRAVDRGVLIEKRLDVRRELRRQRNLDKDERLQRHPGVKERVAPPIRVEPVLKITPRLDRMHGLVLD